MHIQFKGRAFQIYFIPPKGVWYSHIQCPLLGIPLYSWDPRPSIFRFFVTKNPREKVILTVFFINAHQNHDCLTLNMNIKWKVWHSYTIYSTVPSMRTPSLVCFFMMLNQNFLHTFWLTFMEIPWVLWKLLSFYER